MSRMVVSIWNNSKNYCPGVFLSLLSYFILIVLILRFVQHNRLSA